MVEAVRARVVPVSGRARVRARLVPVVSLLVPESVPVRARQCQPALLLGSLLVASKEFFCCCCSGNFSPGCILVLVQVGPREGADICFPTLTKFQI